MEDVVRLRSRANTFRKERMVILPQLDSCVVP